MASHHARPRRSQVKSLFLFSLMMFTVLQDVSGFDCDLSGGSKSVFDKINVLSPKSCPSLISSDDQMFCCQTEESAGITLNYCCDLKSFLQSSNVGIATTGRHPSASSLAISTYGSVPGAVQPPPLHGYQPPPYSPTVTTEVYAKQAAYNPHQY